MRLDCKHRRIYLLSIYYSAPSQAVGATGERGIRHLSGWGAWDVFKEALEKKCKAASALPHTSDAGEFSSPCPGDRICGDGCSVTQLCAILCYPTGCYLPGSSVHGIFQVRILEWLAISYSREPSPPRD